MIKFNMIKKIVILIFFLFSANVFASQASLSSTELAKKSEEIRETIESEKEAISVEELQEDLANRFILGVFGKDALIYSLPEDTSDTLIDEINNLSTLDVQLYSKPFNISNLNGILMILSSFFFVAFSVLAIYFAWVLFEGLLNTQDSGQVFGQKTSTLFSVLKTSTAMIFIVPSYGFSHKPFSDFENSLDGSSYGSFSLSQVFVFKAAGYSNQFSNLIWGSFVNNYQKAYPSLQLPKTYAKELEMKEVLNFVMCVKAYDNEASTKIQLTKASGSSSYDINGRYKSCTLSGNVGFNSTWVKELEKSTEFSDMVNSNIDYEDSFHSLISTTFTGIVEKSVSYADILLSEYNSFSEEEERNGLLINSSNWQSLCDTPEDMYISGRLNEKDIPVLEYYMTKCLSEEYILSFLSEDKTSARSLYTNTILNNSNVGMCADNDILENGTRTFVETSELTTFTPESSLTVEDCVSQTCSDEGLYQCFSAIEFAKSSKENEKMIKQGWLTAGAYSYSLFSGFKNESSKSMVNSLTTSFSYKGGSSWNTSDSDFSTELQTESAYDYAGISSNIIDIPINSINSDSENLFYILDSYFKTFNLSTIVFEEKQKSIALIEPLNGLASIAGKDGLFGIHKFMICSTSPMTVTDGFICGNTTEELHDMGSKMLAFALQLKLSMTVGSIYKNKVSSKDGRSVGKLSQSSQMIQKITGGNAKLFLIIGAITGTSAHAFDAFENTNEYWRQNPEALFTILGILSGSTAEYLKPYLDIALTILLLLGVIFAFFLPLLPYFLWLTVVSGWVVMILEALLVAPVWAATLVTPSNDHTSKTAKKGLLILLTIIMRGPFMVIGLVLAWVLSNILIGNLLEIASVSDALLLPSTGDELTSFFDMMIKMIVFLSLLYFIYNLVFSIIEGFYEIGSNWLFNSSLSPFSTKDRSEKWRNNYQSTKQFLGVR